MREGPAGEVKREMGARETKEKPGSREKSRKVEEEKFWLRKKRKSVGPCRKPTHSGLWSCVIDDDDDDD